MHHRGQPYYLGLLSAADLHGSSQQAVQVGTPIDGAAPSAQPWNVIDNIGLRNLIA